MNEMLAQFHFLRPLWLLATIPALLIAVLLLKRKSGGANWRAAIAPDLIDYLLESTQQIRPQWPWLLLAGWLLAIFALAGPTWEKLPQPVLQKRDGLVIVLDLSLSMYAEDIKPSRLQRARFKVIDILQQRREGLTGLVVYSGDAHVVSPLTDDTATIENLVPALAPAIMPNFGSDAATGIDTALDLLRNSGFERGRILLLSDEISEDDIEKIAARVDGKKWQLAIIGIGTDQGAPIPLPYEKNRNNNEGQERDTGPSGFLKQENGTIAIAQLHRERFNRLASKTNGRYTDIQVDDSDIANALSIASVADDAVRTLEREFDQWRERGPQCILLLLPLAALVFRRGWLLVIFLIPFSMPSQAAQEREWKWRDLWQNANQQAQHDFDEGNSKTAAEKFQDANWRAAAQYRSGDYAAAAESLQAIDSADAHYNRGNALAHEGKFEDAIAAYDTALKKDPTMQDASANRNLAEKLLKQQQKNEQQKNQQGDQSKDNKQSNDSSQNSPQAASQQNASQQNSAQQEQSQNAERQNETDEKKQSTAQSHDQSPQKDKQQANQSAEKDAEEKNAAKNDKRDPNKSDQAEAMRVKDQQEQQKPSDKQAATNKLTPEQRMQQRATEQWLRQVPDDPSGLLRRKFMYESQQRDRQQRNDGKPLW